MSNVKLIGSFLLSLGLGLALVACGDDDTTPPMVDAGIIMVDSGPMPMEDAGPIDMCEAPPPPYGTAVGRTLAPFTLQQCDGTDYSFYNEEWCDPATRFTVISIAAGWCGPCILESRQLTAEISIPYAPRGVRLIQIITQTEDYSAPDLAYCDGWVETFGLINIELIDPAQVTGIYFPDNALPSTIIVDEMGTIRFRENGVSEGLISLKAKLDELLAE